MTGSNIGNFVQINGRKLHYVQFGEGENIVFMHGWGASISAFLFVAKRLKGYRITIFDFAGFGESDAPSVPFSLDDYVSDTLCLLDYLGIKTATFVGHSFGGRVGIYLAVTRKELVKKLVLVDSAGLKPKRGLGYYIRVSAHKMLKRMGRKGLKGSSDYQLLSPTMKKTFVNIVNFYQDEQIKHIDCKTAIFWGKEDRDTPLYMYKKLMKNIPNAQGFLLDGGHFSYVDDLNSFVLILSAFLKEEDE